MSQKELENKKIVNSPTGESFHDSQTEPDSANQNLISPTIENKIDSNYINIKKLQKEDANENIDNLAYDKKLWNNNDLQYPESYLKKETNYDSKLSIDNPETPKICLKEYLNEDLLNALDVSPMVTPKNILKDAANENNNDINNNENIIPISEDMMNCSNNDLFQFSLYSNKNDKENNFNSKEINDINNNPIDELLKINQVNENNENKNKNKNQKDEDDFNKVMDTFRPPNMTINYLNQNKKNPNDTSNAIDIDNNIKNINNINNNVENKNIGEDEGGGNKKNKDNKLKDSPAKEIIGSDNKNISEKGNQYNKLNINKNYNINKFSNLDSGENKKKSYNALKNSNPSQIQHPYITHMPHFPYATQPHIIQTLQPNTHENKFDGKKNYIFVPIQAIKKNTKMKKPFEIREGDWTCSDCGNLNFAFRIKCNRCKISKESSDKKKTTSNNDKNQGNNNKEINNNLTNNNLNNNAYYPNINMIQYKGFIFPNQLFKAGESFYPKYYPYMYVPIQGQYMKSAQEKKIPKEDNSKSTNNQMNKEKENKTNDKDKVTEDKNEDVKKRGQ